MGNTSSLQVHFPASHPSLPKGVCEKNMFAWCCGYKMVSCFYSKCLQVESYNSYTHPHYTWTIQPEFWNTFNGKHTETSQSHLVSSSDLLFHVDSSSLLGVWKVEQKSMQRLQQWRYIHIYMYLYKGTHLQMILLMVQKYGDQKLRLVVYPNIFRVLYIPHGLLPSTVEHLPY